MSNKRKLGEILVENGMLTQEQLMDALQYQKTNNVRIGDALVELGIISNKSLIKVLEFQYGAKDSVDKDIRDIEILHRLEKQIRPTDSIISIFKNSIELKASDVHLSHSSPIIYRIHGNLVTVDSQNLNDEKLREYASTLLRRAGILSEVEKLEGIKEIDFSFDLDSLNRFRVNIFRQRGHYSIAARSIPNNIPSWKDLSLPDTIKEFTTLKKGLVLVTGATGSGKSTTLAALINSINEERSCHIITLEDPIEFVHENKKSIVNQREIGRDSESFGNGLRSAMRQDPDVILVGEMRDFETIQTAITAAETGHLVFATLHTNSASKTIDRIIDVFPGEQQNQIRTQLADTLKGVLAQELLPTVNNSRTVAVELLKTNPAVRNLIREGKNYQIDSVIETGKKYGMITMAQSLKRLLYNGTISQEVYNECNSQLPHYK